MTHGTVVLLGNTGPETASLAESVHEFGWILETAADLDHLRRLSRQFNIVAVVFDPRGLDLGAEQAIHWIRAIEPDALLIPCLRFSDIANWPELADAGAFHALSLPFHPSEVRQSMAFVWSARIRRNANVVPMLRVKKAEAGADLATAETSVA